VEIARLHKGMQHIQVRGDAGFLSWMFLTIILFPCIIHPFCLRLILLLSILMFGVRIKALR
jgi:hypothetical protein